MSNTPSLTPDINMVAYCGLYCAECRMHKKGKCPGCHENVKATWCTVRSCCMENDFASCAECKELDDPMSCKKYNNIFAKFFGFIFRSDRAACIRQIKEIGIDGHAEKMAGEGRPSFKR